MFNFVSEHSGHQWMYDNCILLLLLMLDSDWSHWAFQKQTHCHSKARSKAYEKGGMEHWGPQHETSYHSLLTVLWECQHRGWTRRVACPFQTGSDIHCGKCCLWNGHSGWRCALQFLQLVYCSRWTGRHKHTTRHQSTCPTQCFTYTVVTHTHTQQCINLHVPCNAWHTK